MSDRSFVERMTDAVGRSRSPNFGYFHGTLCVGGMITGVPSTLFKHPFSWLTSATTSVADRFQYSIDSLKLNCFAAEGDQTKNYNGDA
ncbi:MAG: hypothetical protein U1E46_08975 [Hyphomicrobiales bacterium]